MARSGIVLLAAATGLLAFASAGVGREHGGVRDKETQPAQTQKNDLVRISGVFAVVQFETEGQKQPEASLKQMKVIQKGAEWSFDVGGLITKGRDTIVLAGPVSHIDCLYLDGPLRGTRVLGIVKVEGDRVTYCWAQSGDPRPTTFATGPNTGLTLFVLQRLPQVKVPLGPG